MRRRRVSSLFAALIRITALEAGVLPSSRAERDHLATAHGTDGALEAVTVDVNDDGRPLARSELFEHLRGTTMPVLFPVAVSVLSKVHARFPRRRFVLRSDRVRGGGRR